MRRLMFVWLLAFSLAVSPAWGAGGPERAVPGDALVVVHVADLSRLLSAFRQSPLSRAWNDPEVRAFTAPLRESLGEARGDGEAAGPGWWELVAGPAILWVSLPEGMTLQDVDELEGPEFGLLMGLPEDPEAKAKLLAEVDDWTQPDEAALGSEEGEEEPGEPWQ